MGWGAFKAFIVVTTPYLSYHNLLKFSLFTFFPKPMTIFSKIIKGEIPCHKIAEDAHYFAFLDIRPLQRGHVLVVPKAEIDYLFDLDTTLLSGILPFAQKIAKAIEKVVPCKRVGVAVVGLEVPHAHVHLVPLNQISDLDFTASRPTFTPQEFEETAQAIRQALADLG